MQNAYHSASHKVINGGYNNYYHHYYHDQVVMLSTIITLSQLLESKMFPNLIIKKWASVTSKYWTFKKHRRLILIKIHSDFPSQVSLSRFFCSILRQLIFFKTHRQKNTPNILIQWPHGYYLRVSNLTPWSTIPDLLCSCQPTPISFTFLSTECDKCSPCNMSQGN